MPQVVVAAVIAGGAAAAGAAIVGTAIATAFWTAAISTAIFGGASYLLQRRVSAPSLADKQRGLQQTVRSPAASRRLLYGRVRVGGTLVFAESTGPKNDILHLAIALAGHEVTEIEQVLVNDLPSDDERYVKAPALRATGLRFVPDAKNARVGEITNGYWVTDVAIGDYWVETGPRLDRSGFTSGQVLHITGSAHNDGLYRIRATGKDDVRRHHLKVERIDGGEIVAETVEGALTLQERYLRINSHLGSANQAADPDMVASLEGWTSEHRLRGIAYLYARLAYHDNVWLSGIPNITAVVRGKAVYDPRTGRTEYSTNPALIIADYLTLPRPMGLGVPYSDIDEDWLIASANICDEEMGQVTIPGRPAVTRRRYECHAAIDLSEDREQVLNKLAATMAGRVVYTGGRWRIMAGAYQIPTVHLDESHLRDRLRVQPRLSRQELANSVRGTYVSEVDGFQPADFPPIQDPAALAEDNGEALWHDLEFPYTTNVWNAQQLARIHLAKTRQQITVQYPCTLAGLKAVAGGTVAITNARMGWTEKPFEVIDWRLATYEDEQGQPLLGVDLTLRETAPHVYQVGELFPDEPSPPTNLPRPWDIAPVEDLTVSSGLDSYTVDANGDIRSRARVEWTPSADPRVIQYEVQYRRTNEDAWNTVISLGAYMHIEPVYHGEQLEVRVRPRTSLGAGPWVLVEHTVVAVSRIDGEKITDVLPVPDVRGLELYGQANDTDFDGRDAKFVWRESSITEWQALGWDAAKLGARDLYFRDYEVTVYDIETGQIRRTEHVVDPEYTYSYEKNVEDSKRLGLPGPRRQFRVEVVARGRQSQVSRMPAKITVQNPAPELPAGWSLMPGYFEASASFIPPDDTDFRRINVYVSTQQGFTPGPENLAWQGSDSPARIADLTQGTTYYYRYQAEDAFGPGAMSGELSFTTKQLALPDVSGVQEAIDDVEDWLREHDDEFEVVRNGITSAQQAIADETQARTVQYNALDARVTAAEGELASKASITYVDDAVAGEASARATAISQINAELGDVGAAVTAVSTALADLETGLSAEYTLTVDAGGNVTGIKLRSDPTGSQMTFLASAFAFATPGGPYTPFVIENGIPKFLGRTEWSQVTGAGKPADNADNTKTTIDGGLVTTGTVQLQDANSVTRAGITAAGTGDSAVRLWAGETFANRGSAPFRVTQDGKLVATEATISGVIASDGLIITANGSIRSGKSSYGDPSTGWWIGSEEGLHKLAITNQDETKGLRFDGNDLIILRDTQLRGADAYNNNSIYIHERLPMPTHVLKQVKTGGGALIETSEGDWRVAVHNGPGRIIARYTLLGHNGIRYFTLWDPFRLKTKWNPGTLYELRQGDYVRIGMGSDPDGFEFNHVAVYLETRSVASGALRTRGVVKTDAGTYYTDELAGFPLPGTLEIVWTPITETSALVEFRLFNWTRSVTVPYLHVFGLPFVPYFVEAMTTGSGGVGVNIAVTEFIFLQEG